jgi:hypothetical protein
MQTAFHKMRILFPLVIFLSLLFPHTVFSEDSPKEDIPKIYKYVGKNKVVVFTDDINKVPEALRSQVEILEVKKESASKPKKVLKKAPKTIIQSLQSLSLRDPFIRNILIFAVVLVLFWIIKLWIKNMILKMIARIAIKIAIVGFLYMVAHHWFFAPKEGSFFSAVKESISQYRDVLPIDRATQEIKSYNKKQEENKKALDAVSQEEKIVDKRGR